MDDRAVLLDRLRNEFDRAPIRKWLGMRLGYCASGVARVYLTCRKELQDNRGAVTPGIVALLAQTAGSYAATSSAPGASIRAVEFKVNFLGADEAELLAVGEVVRRERFLATCRLEVIQGADRVVAVGLATYLLQAP